MPETVLQTEQLTKIYKSADRELVVLDKVSFSAEQGTTLSIIGPSGSGKTTLLGLCAGLDIPSSGAVSLMGFKINAMNEDDRAYIRNQSTNLWDLYFKIFSCCPRSLPWKM
jgi:putative ABC transport system ATP-binding protein